MESSNSRVNQLKCSNCGSANFAQESDSTFKCAYCGSTIQIERNIQEQFVSALGSRTRSNKNLHILVPTYSQDEFLKNTIINLGINPDTPIDVLKATFSPVQVNYNCYIVLDTDFSIVKISGIGEKPDQSTTGEEPTKGFCSCIKVSGDKEDKTNRIMLEDAEDMASLYETLPLTKENLNKIHYTLPDKKDIDQAIEENLNNIKNDILSECKDKNVVVVHKVNKIDMYIAPEYTVEYEYNGKKHKEFSFAYKISNQSDHPVATNSMTKQIKKTTNILSSISLGASALAIIFAFIHIFCIRALDLIVVDAILAVCSLITYFVTKCIANKKIVKTKTKTFNLKKQLLLEHFNKNKLPKLTSQDVENINNYIRWY